MMPSESGKTLDVTRWAIAQAVQAATVAVALVSDAGLELVTDGRTAEWKSSGERACFTLQMQTLDDALPAGWYVLDGMLQPSEEVMAMPCLYPAYARGADGDAQIALPEPDRQGRVRALVLFKYDVVGLRFCPLQGPGRFFLGDFSLRRVSRLHALRYMLGPTSRSPGGRILRCLGFAARALRDGVSRATDDLHRKYRRRLLPLEADDYASWVARYDTLTVQRMEQLHARAASFDQLTMSSHAKPFRPQADAQMPLISILLPVYQTPERWLRRCIDSVINQAYPHWQLCIVDDASPSAQVMEVLREYVQGDPRIEVMCRSENGHISAASNSALELARGGFVALLDHDDELRPHALLEMAEAIVANPQLQLLYSDEDKLDAEGRRFDPYFKPDFDTDLLRSQNYVCHFTCIRTDLVREVGGFREGFEGSQDHDLILRCTERLRPEQIRHIPKVLYHWRAIPGSTALTRDAKDYASSAGARAVDEHLQRCHPGARAQELSHGHYRVCWPLPEPAPKVSLIVPTRDKVELLRMCVQSILERTTYPDFEIVVVDNQSSDAAALAYLTELEQVDRVRVLRYDAPFNYSAINNWAVRQCDGTVLGLVNNDIEVITPDWLQELVSQAVRPEVGAAGAMLYYPNDTIQHAGVVLGVHGVAAHIYAGLPRGYPGHGGRARVAQTLSAVTGACLLVCRSKYEEVGGLDESLQVAFNDIDFCLRLREAGYRNIWTPFAELYHHESASRGTEDTEEKKQRFASEVEFMQQRWGEALLADPAYNVNLSLRSLSCELAVPPRG